MSDDPNIQLEALQRKCDVLQERLHAAEYDIKRMLQARSKIDLCYYCAQRYLACKGQCNRLAMWKGACKNEHGQAAD